MILRNKIIIPILIILAAVFDIESARPAEKKGKDEFVVVIDAGHGGRDIGATDNHVNEKDINLGVAKKLAARIKKHLKNVKVVMTRDNDTFISLQERADIANRNKGNLFVSIHTNSVDKSNPNRKTVAGTSVYALGLHKDKNNLQVARRENSVIELEKNFEQKYSGFDPSKDESYIIFEMAQKKNLGQSLKFADMAQKHLVKDASRADRGVKQAGFWVLWATSMPAVLVELDFICNPNSAVFMGSEKGQEKLALALCNAIEQYVEHHNRSAKETSSIQVVDKDEENALQTPVLAAVTHPKKKSAAPAQVSSSTKAASAVKRRRRSETARKASAIRNFETEAIPLHREAERLAIVEEKPREQVVAAVDNSEAEPKKGKKDRKENSRKKKGKNDVRTYNNKKVIVNPDGSTSLAPSDNSLRIKQKTHKSVSGYHSKVEKLTTVYKIQILASADVLKQNSPRFCGLTPVKSFKENNLYKYTYGESENRQEMEKLLKTVKEKIPDAFIISSRK